jgi:serine/threonine protein kinase
VKEKYAAYVADPEHRSLLPQNAKVAALLTQLKQLQHVQRSRSAISLVDDGYSDAEFLTELEKINKALREELATAHIERDEDAPVIVKFENKGKQELIALDGVIGAGCFGQVVYAQNVETGQWLAVKGVFPPSISEPEERVTAIQSQSEEIQSEANILAQLGEFHGTASIPDESGMPRFYIAEDLAPQYDLDEYIANLTKRLYKQYEPGVAQQKEPEPKITLTPKLSRASVAEPSLSDTTVTDGSASGGLRRIGPADVDGTDPTEVHVEQSAKLSLSDTTVIDASASGGLRRVGPADVDDTDPTEVHVEQSSVGSASPAPEDDPELRDKGLQEFLQKKRELITSVSTGVLAGSMLEVSKIAQMLCTEVDAMHNKSILHRDLKPANVKYDGSRRLKIVDWGTAAILPSGVTSVTSDQAIGSPTYMPRQAVGKHYNGTPVISPDGNVCTYSKANDIYAVGVSVEQMLNQLLFYKQQLLCETEIQGKKASAIARTGSGILRKHLYEYSPSGIHELQSGRHTHYLPLEKGFPVQGDLVQQLLIEQLNSSIKLVKQLRDAPKQFELGQAMPDLRVIAGEFAKVQASVQRLIQEVESIQKAVANNVIASPETAQYVELSKKLVLLGSEYESKSKTADKATLAAVGRNAIDTMLSESLITVNKLQEKAKGNWWNSLFGTKSDEMRQAEIDLKRFAELSGKMSEFYKKTETDSLHVVPRTVKEPSHAPQDRQIHSKIATLQAALQKSGAPIVSQYRDAQSHPVKPITETLPSSHRQRPPRPARPSSMQLAELHKKLAERNKDKPPPSDKTPPRHRLED